MGVRARADRGATHRNGPGHRSFFGVFPRPRPIGFANRVPPQSALRAVVAALVVSTSEFIAPRPAHTPQRGEGARGAGRYELVWSAPFVFLRGLSKTSPYWLRQQGPTPKRASRGRRCAPLAIPAASGEGLRCAPLAIPAALGEGLRSRVGGRLILAVPQPPSRRSPLSPRAVAVAVARCRCPGRPPCANEIEITDACHSV